MDLHYNIYYDRLSNIKNKTLKFDRDDLNEMKRKRILDQKCWSILKEFVVFSIFVSVLYVVTFSNLSSSSMQYNILFKNNFVLQQSSNEIGINSVRTILNI